MILEGAYDLIEKVAGVCRRLTAGLATQRAVKVTAAANDRAPTAGPASRGPRLQIDLGRVVFSSCIVPCPAQSVLCC